MFVRVGKAERGEGGAVKQEMRLSSQSEDVFAYVITPISKAIRGPWQVLVPRYQQAPSRCMVNSQLVMPRVTFIVGYTRLAIPSIRPPRAIFSQYRTKSVTSGPQSTEEISLARRWFAKFNPDTIPKRLCELSFSRSSGPGGQNVNK